jgi:transposase InsO family protein
LQRRHSPAGVIAHADRGSQYCSKDYQSRIIQYRLLGSTRGKGNWCDNACAESFFHTWKAEAIHGERFSTRALMRQTVSEYIEIDYNRTRRHRANGYITAVAFEAQPLA